MSSTTVHSTHCARFAPTPSGRLHAGNLFAALIAYIDARRQQQRLVLRIEDLDTQRCKPAYVQTLIDDLHRFGFTWDNDRIVRQSERTDAYQRAFDSLKDRGMVYPCFCTRADLHAASAPHVGQMPFYAGACAHLSKDEIETRMAAGVPAWRVRVDSRPLEFDDALQGHKSYRLDKLCGDFVVRRRDTTFAYQLAVVVDDAAAGVDSVVRGCDLLESTAMQSYLYRLLGLPAPMRYLHIPLLVDDEGVRLSKRQKSADLDALLQRFETPQQVIGHLAYVAGLVEKDRAYTPDQLVKEAADLSCLAGKTMLVWS